MKRDMITPEQQAALSLVKERLQKHNQQVESSFMAALEQSRRKLDIYVGQVTIRPCRDMRSLC